MKVSNEPGVAGQPLCRSYVCLAFGDAGLSVPGGLSGNFTRLYWAVGVLSDGSAHGLDAWEAATPSWPAIATCLYARGIERLRFVLTTDPSGASAALAPMFRGVIALDPTQIDSVDLGHRGYVLKAQEVATTLDRRFRRAASRQGGFADAASAAAVLRRSAQGSLQSGWPARVPSVGCPRALTGLAAG